MIFCFSFTGEVPSAILPTAEANPVAERSESINPEETTTTEPTGHEATSTVAEQPETSQAPQIPPVTEPEITLMGSTVPTQPTRHTTTGIPEQPEPQSPMRDYMIVFASQPGMLNTS